MKAQKFQMFYDRLQPTTLLRTGETVDGVVTSLNLRSQD